MNKAPAVWSNQTFPIVVAGAVTNSGDNADSSRGVSTQHTQLGGRVMALYALEVDYLGFKWEETQRSLLAL